MGKKPQHRAALIRSAVRLFRRHGFAGTGTKDILADCGAPRGSLYHYFPGGKEEIGAAAVEAAGQQVSETLHALAAQSDSPGAFVEAYLDQLGGWLQDSGFRDGCPVATTLLETTPQSGPITGAGRQALAQWRAVIETVLRRHGWPAERVEPTATSVLAAIEGALVLARVEGSVAPLRQTADELRRLLEAV